VLSKACFWLCLGWFLNACSVSQTTYYQDGEGRFSEKMIDSITPEQTSRTWLMQQFGSPFWVDQAPNEVEIATWPITKQVYKQRSLLVVFRIRKMKENSQYLHVVMQKGTVVKHWLDYDSDVDVPRVTYVLGLDKPLTSMSSPEAVTNKAAWLTERNSVQTKLSSPAKADALPATEKPVLPKKALPQKPIQSEIKSRNTIQKTLTKKAIIDA